MYRGTVKVWYWKQGWGFIKVDDGIVLPADVEAKLQQQKERSQKKAADKGRADNTEKLPGLRISLTGHHRGYRGDRGILI